MRTTTAITGTILTSRIRKVLLCLAASICLAVLAVGASGQETSVNNEKDSSWSKTSQERDSRLEAASREPYVVSHVYVAGNVHVKDRDIRKRLLTGFTAGDIFVREAFDNSLKEISRIKAIYPVTLNDIDVRLDEKEKHIEVTINISERRKD